LRAYETKKIKLMVYEATWHEIDSD